LHTPTPSKAERKPVENNRLNVKFVLVPSCSVETFRVYCFFETGDNFVNMTTAASAMAIGTIIAIVISIVVALVFLLIFLVAFCRTRIYDDTNIRKRILQSQYGAIGQQEEVTTLLQPPQPVIRHVALPALPPIQQVVVPQCQQEQICLPAPSCVRRNSCSQAAPTCMTACPMPPRVLSHLDLAMPTSCNPCGGAGYGATSYNACSKPMYGYRTGAASPACGPSALTSVVPVMAATNSCFQTSYVAGNRM
jgi:hypothetical protein